MLFYALAHIAVQNWHTYFKDVTFELRRKHHKGVITFSSVQRTLGDLTYAFIISYDIMRMVLLTVAEPRDKKRVALHLCEMQTQITPRTRAV